MYNTMVKLRNKKAFTLVEMMAVIAIVAVLVAVVVPIIGNSTTKARAATNAANLRSVESELATMKVSNPECFVSGAEVESGTVESLAQGMYKYIYNFWYGDDEYSIQYGSVTASGGTLILYEDNLTKKGSYIEISGVPTSVALSADSNMNVTEGMDMVIFLSGNTFTAAYKGTDDAGNDVYFDKDCFAEVAETGKFTGTGVKSDDGAKDWLEDLGGKVEEAVEEIEDAAKKTACTANVAHTDDGTWHCKYCKKPMCELTYRYYLTTNSYAHSYDDEHNCKGCEKNYCTINGHSYTYDDSIHTCTNEGCTITNEAHSFDESGVCVCGRVKPEHEHYWLTDTTGSGRNKKTVHYCRDCPLKHDENWTKDSISSSCCHCAGEDCTLTMEHSYTTNALGQNGAVCDNCGYVKNHTYESKRFSSDCKHCDQSQNASCHTTN